MDNMKDLVYNVELETYNKVLNLANEQGYAVEIIEGVLLDSALIYNSDIKFGRSYPRKYIIFQDHYLNEWSSKLVMTLTDNEELAEQFMRDLKQDEIDREIEEQEFLKKIKKN